jgi:Protein of unknown function (DUF4232)
MEPSRRTIWWIVGLALALIAGVAISVLTRGDLKRAVEGTSTHSPMSTLPTTTALPKGSTTTTAGDAVAPCHNGQIAVSGAGGGSGLGHQDQVILFTNQSQSTCALSGYPGVAGLDAQGNQAVQAERTPNGYLGGLQSGTTTPSVSLAPGQTASAIVEGTDNPVGSATSCPSYPTLLVTPPNLTVSVRVTVTGLGTNPPGLPGCSQIEVHPVVPGSSGGAN